MCTRISRRVGVTHYLSIERLWRTRAGEAADPNVFINGLTTFARGLQRNVNWTQSETSPLPYIYRRRPNDVHPDPRGFI